MMKSRLLLLALTVASYAFAAGEKIKTVTVIGEYTLLTTSSAVTFAQAHEFAREDAKRRALEQVCPTKINAWDKLEISSGGETFNSLTIAQVDGEIYDFSVIKENVEQSKIRPVEMIFTCKAKVKVKIGLEPDPNFVAAVKGLQAVYYEGEALRFSVKPSQDCYLKIFLFADTETGYQIFPNSIDNDFKLLKNEKVQFPISGIYDFRITKDTDAPIETNRLVFVFTKQERVYNQQTASRSDIERWMAKIPNNEKYIVYSLFDIRKQSQ